MTFSWTRYDGIERVEYKHFSECLEYVQSTHNKKLNMRKSIPSKIRYQILERDGFKCVYCGKGKDDGAILHVDHKLSVKDGGSDDPDNLATSCSECNFGKGDSSI